MAATITLPNGVKFRSASQRRFVLVMTYQGRATTLKRSDSLATIRAHFNKPENRDIVARSDGRRWRHYIVDNVTGKVQGHGETDYRTTDQQP